MAYGDIQKFVRKVKSNIEIHKRRASYG